MIKFFESLIFPHGIYMLKKHIIALRSRVILDKRTRHHWKNFMNKKTVNDLVKKSCWGVSYSVFDGEELLEDSIKSIRNQVDYINVVYQRHSWYGNPADPKLLDLLTDLKNRGLIDELIEYIPNYKVRPLKQEKKKRNIGLKYAKKHGVDFFMCMDTDEFYVEKEIQNVKKLIIKNGITHSFVPVVAYSTPTCRSLNPSGLTVQFFSRIYPWSKLDFNPHNVSLVDPTRQLKHTADARYYVFLNIEMHHMTGYRKNLQSKIRNSSNKGFNKQDKSVFKNALENNSVKVPNIFNIRKI